MIRVLLVEDSPTQAAQLSIHLEEAGFAVEHQKDAERAFARLAEQRFDLVLSDLVLPGESGFDLCRRIKGDAALARTPVMVLTSQADPLNVLRGLAVGADGFMTKDHPPDEIVHRVQRTLAIDVPDDDASFQGQSFRVSVSRRQLLNVLLSAFEDVVVLNRRLIESESALRTANQELSGANEALGEAHRVKDKFLGIAAHDLRSPLSTIQGFVSFFADGSLGPLTADQQDAIDRIGRSVDTMLLLLSELLDVSALRSGKIEFRIERQDPLPLLREALDTVTLAARQKGIAIELAIADGLPAVDLDRRRMLEVVSNLLSNAVKFCSTGDRITLGARASADRLEIWVRDTGPGLRREELPRLFQPFTRLSAKPTAGEKSTGLGLSIVKELVERLGGSIHAESTLGHGSEFRVELPLCRAGHVS